MSKPQTRELPSYGTHFVESEILMAALNDAWEDVDAMVADMYPGERDRLDGVLHDISSTLRGIKRRDR